LTSKASRYAEACSKVADHIRGVLDGLRSLMITQPYGPTFKNMMAVYGFWQADLNIVERLRMECETFGESEG
jgi:hypothetical protein